MVTALVLMAVAAVPPCVVRAGALGPGAVVEAGVPYETGPARGAELGLVGGGRVRLGPETTVTCQDAGLRLVTGRAWITAPRDLDLAVGGRALSVAAGSSVVARALPGALPTVVVRTGAVDGAEFRVTAGEVAVGDIVRPGGAGVFDVAARGGDRWTRREIRAFVLRALATAPTPRPRPEPVPPGFRGDAELFGADGGPAGRLLEAGLRPEPFR